jgi:guanylate kinase
MNARGFPVVLSAPSGGGKSTVAAGLLKALPFLMQSRSVTTRVPRGDEVRGREYDFITVEEFGRLRDSGGLAEWAGVHGHFYGTPRAFLDAEFAAGRCPLLVIDVQGGLQIRRSVPGSVLLFLMPHDLAVTRKRLEERMTDQPGDIEMRLANALKEIAAAAEYDYHIVNESLSAAVGAAVRVIQEEYDRKSQGLIRNQLGS